MFGGYARVERREAEEERERERVKDANESIMRAYDMQGERGEHKSHE